MNILSPSILAADFTKLGEQIRVIEEAGVPYLHFDVMDGLFVPSISFGMPVLTSVRKNTSLFLDVHLMIREPERYVETFASCGADLINFHLEASDDIAGTIERIRATGKKVGITIKPHTPVEELRPWIDRVDMVLIMTVEPGFGGQKMIPECLDKVRAVRAMADERGIELDIEVDGGIHAGNVSEAIAAGANVIVAGSAIFKDDIAVNIDHFRKMM